MIAYMCRRGAIFQLCVRASDGSGEERQLTATTGGKTSPTWLAKAKQEGGNPVYRIAFASGTRLSTLAFTSDPADPVQVASLPVPGEPTDRSDFTYLFPKYGVIRCR